MTSLVYLAPGPFGAGGQFFGLGGLPLNLGTITTYAAGGTTPLATYTTSAGSVQNANPIVLGTDGRPPNEIWITADSYRFDLKDSLGNLIKTYDDLSTFSSAANLTFLQAGTGAQSRSVQDKERDIFSIRDWLPAGYVTDGSVDYSTQIQAAIDAVSTAGGGTLLCPTGKYKCNVILKDGVYLWGTLSHGYLPGSITQVEFIAAATGAVIDTPVTAISNCGVIGINTQGLGSATAAKGVRFRNVLYGVVKGFNANNMADEGVLFDSSCIACTLEDVLAVNCVLNRTRVAKIGAIDIHGTDHYLDSIEGTISGSIEGTVQSPSLYCVGILIRATNCKKIIGLTGEFSDIGIEVTGSGNPLLSNSAEFNYGHGWNVTGGGNKLTNCQGLNNSQDTTNTYDNFLASAASSNNTFDCCNAGDELAKKAKYGFEDLVSSATNKNKYINCTSTTAVTAQFLSQTSNGSAFSFPNGTVKALTINSVTPDVTGYERWASGNNTPTTITDFTGGVQGQFIIVNCGDSNTTIQHNGATISTINAGNVKLRSGQNYFFWKSGPLWREVMSFPLGTTADVGDNAKSLQYRLNEETQIYATPIIADRAVSLSTTGVMAGAKFRIVRAASCTGAFNVNVGTGPLKAMNTAGSFADVEYNGSAWVLTAYGVL